MSVRLVGLTARARSRMSALLAKHTRPRARAPLRAATPALEGAYGLTPEALHKAYGLEPGAPEPQTIAIVDAYNDPTAEADLKAYDETLKLPACTQESGCFRRVNQEGKESSLPFPQNQKELEAHSKGTATEKQEAQEAPGWNLEVSLDIETAHAVCQNCKILLVEAANSSFNDLEVAEDSAVALGAQEVSNSFGGPECVFTGPSTPPVCVGDAPAFNHPGIVITASAGDAGYLSWQEKTAQERKEGVPGYAQFPASSSHVVAVGGTRLELTSEGKWERETVWNGEGAGGGGCSIAFAAPAWQLSLVDWAAVGCGGGRSVADVAADADPVTGLAVHDSSLLHYPGRFPECEQYAEHWCTIGGTSLASPLIAGVFALAGGAHGVAYPARTLYENAQRTPSSLHDVVEGSNGECANEPTAEGLSGCTAPAEAATSCSSQLRCLAGTGYDGPSGLGTPEGIAAFKPADESTPSPSGEEEHSSGTGGGSGTEPPPVSPPTKPPATVSTGSGVSATPAPVFSAPPPSGSEGVHPSAQLQISALHLAPRAAAAIRRAPVNARALAFMFKASSAGVVRVALWRRVRRHGRTTWTRVYGPVSLSVHAGAGSGKIAAARSFARGVYRLALAPPSGAPATLVFTVL